MPNSDPYALCVAALGLKIYSDLCICYNLRVLTIPWVHNSYGGEVLLTTINHSVQWVWRYTVFVNSQDSYWFSSYSYVLLCQTWKLSSERTAKHVVSSWTIHRIWDNDMGVWIWDVRPCHLPQRGKQYLTNTAFYRLIRLHLLMECGQDPSSAGTRQHTTQDKKISFLELLVNVACSLCMMWMNLEFKIFHSYLRIA